MTQTIRIDRLALPMMIGILDFEREAPQTVEISIDIHVVEGLAPGDFVSYAPVVEHLIALSDSRRHIDLVEELTGEIFAFLFTDTRIASAQVTVMKPDIFAQAAGVGVTETRLNTTSRSPT
jgi:FolB domain-containing protein